MLVLPVLPVLEHTRHFFCRHVLSFQDYDTAKLLKEAETQLKSLGQQLAQLEVAKRQAVEDEDYDRAKMLKVRENGEVPCPCSPPHLRQSVTTGTDCHLYYTSRLTLLGIKL